jgi:TolB-like protein/cytochrome c-type biogenesis protein CcmH/NrfG
MEAVWPRVVVEEGSLSQAIYELRRALGERPDEHRYIVTVPGRGYQFVAEVAPRARPQPNLAVATPSATAQPSPMVDLRPTGISPALGADTDEDASARLGVTAGARRPEWPARYVVVAVALVAFGIAAWYGVGMRDRGRFAAQPGVAPTTMATVAVLPLVDLSHQRDQQLFSDGLSEELIHLLAQSASLRVLARTSSFSFRNQDVDVATIAGRLGATHVLEGSVRTSGNRVRIAVQLIDGATSSHVWSQTYDRNIEDALAIQQEIASSIATSLNATLAGERRGKGTTTSLRAYEHFQLARFFAARRQSGDFRRAEQEYRRAIELDPVFSRAWTGLAGIYWASADRFDDLGLSRGEALARMRDAVERALAIDPNLAEAHVRRAMLRVETGDRSGGRQQLQQAAALDPNNPVVLGWLGGIALSEGRPDEAVAFQRRAVENDPVTAATRANLGTFLFFAGRFDEASIELRKALQIAGAPDAAWGNPNVPASDTGISLAKVLIAQRRFDDALALIQSWPEGQLRDSCLTLAYRAQGDDRKADAALERLIASPTAEPHWVAEALGQRGDVDQAFRWMASAAERSRERGEGWQIWRFDIRYSPFMSSLHGDRRWQAWLAEQQ